MNTDNKLKGLVVRNTGNAYEVLPTGADPFNPALRVECKVKGNFRLRGIRTTNPVAVGDIVTFIQTSDSDVSYITEIQPRRNYIIRKASNLSKEAHILAANLDMTVLVASLAHPVTSTTFIDRFLATAEAYGIPPVLALNKTDLMDNEADGREYLNAVADLYRTIGYTVVECSANTGDGIDILHNLLAGKITLFSGNSGVGKTTLINTLIPGLNLRTAPVSAIHDTGQHTTTFSQMFPLPGKEGGYIIDTPGVKGFGTIEFEAAQIGHYFPEIFKYSHQCRYNNCTHTHEPGCAVRQAVEQNLISQSRYASYLSILEDSTDDKYRKPF